MKQGSQKWDVVHDFPQRRIAAAGVKVCFMSQ